ncbi:ATP-binding protein [Streptomyces maremycinicus]|nr:ATP-binding protein [Streptomyces sp. B9173]
MRSHADGDGCNGPEEHLMCAGYALDGDAGCIADARRHAVTFLDRAHAEHRLLVPARARDLTQLVVSELVTNALKYAPGPVLMDLRISAQAVDVVVWDSDPTEPAARDADPGRIGQHGLEIVKAVAEDFSVRQEPVGKRVTARIALSGTSGSDSLSGTSGSDSPGH